MTVTAAKLKAVVTADTEQANRDLKQFGRTVSETGRDAQRSLGGMLGGALTFAGISAGAIAVGKFALAMNGQREIAENVRKTLTAYAGDAQTAAAATDALTKATDGGVSRMQAQQMAAQLLGMGLAKTADQVGQLTRMAVMLGDKTLTVQERMASWNAMLAIQSIERLDTFGISSGRVRQRIEEMQAADANLSREQAFVNSVLEIGASKLAAVEAQGVTAATSVDRLASAWLNFKDVAAEAVQLTVVIDTITQGITNLGVVLSKEGAAEREYAQAFAEYRVAAEEVVRIQALINDGRQLATPLARENAQASLEAAQAHAAEALANYQHAQTMYQIEQGTYQVVDAERDYIRQMAVSTAATKNATKAAQELRIARLGVESGRLAQAAGVGGGVAGENLREWQRERIIAQQKVNEAEIKASTKAAQSAGNAYYDAMTEAGRKAADMIQGYLGEGMNFSINLNDMQGANPLKPGAGGPFEEIYRLQAWLKDGTWAESAAKLGGDRGRIEELVKSFQMGNFTPDVLGMIDIGGLRAMAQQKLAAQASQDQLAGMIGADSGLLKAILGQDKAGAGAVLSDADAKALAGSLKSGVLTGLDAVAAEQPTVIQRLLGGGGKDGVQFNFDGTLATGLAGAIDTELSQHGEKLRDKGAAAWDLMEEGFVTKAGKSAAFASAVDAMVANSLKQYLPKQ
jgi:hypothetical protein